MCGSTLHFQEERLVVRGVEANMAELFGGCS